ncbi:MAG: precorrin-4 C(11)-methyltransferase [Nitrospirae bacterium]|nr:precorrin-4 C(11)-methyltransferase [Nitrospirota bacterium]
MNPTVHFVGAGPGDPELLTLKGMRLLQKADLVLYAGSLVHPDLLSHVRPGAELLDTSGMVLETILQTMAEAVSRGRRVVRLASGDPTLFGALTEMIHPLIAAGIDVEVVPGVSSFLAAAARLGRELTVPEVAQTVILTRAEGRTPVPPSERLSELARHRTTMAIFLSAHLGREVEGELLKAYSPETPVAVVYRATWLDERRVEGRLGDLSRLIREAGVTKSALILVGPFLEARGTRSRLYSPDFHHGFRPKGVP